LDIIFPVELLDEEQYKKFGIKEIFLSLCYKYKNQKIENEIAKNKINTINYSFPRRVKSMFKILSSSMGQNNDVKGTAMISTFVIKIISKIYNHSLTTNECLDYIESKGYINKITLDDTSKRKTEKTFASISHKNWSATKQVDYRGWIFNRRLQ